MSLVLTCDELRAELHRFSKWGLRQELTELRSQLLRDLRAEIPALHTKKRPSSATFAKSQNDAEALLTKRRPASATLRQSQSPSLSTPDDLFPGTPLSPKQGNAWLTGYDLPCRQNHVARPSSRKTHLKKNEGMESSRTGRATRRSAAHPGAGEENLLDPEGSQALVRPLPPINDETEEILPPKSEPPKPPGRDLRMLADCESFQEAQFQRANTVKSVQYNLMRSDSSISGCVHSMPLQSRARSELSLDGADFIGLDQQASFKAFSPPSLFKQEKPMCNGTSSRRLGLRKNVTEVESEFITAYQVRLSNDSKRRTTKVRLRSVVKASEDSLLARFCDFLGDFAEMGIVTIIILNGIFIGVQTDYQARTVKEKIPAIFPITEIIFCIVFTAELIVKLVAYQMAFFIDPGWAWNVFDMFLVLLQLVEVLGMFIADHETGSGSNPVGNVGFLRLLRVLRLLRILRLVRLLRFVGEFATILSSILNCVRALCWTMVLLLMMIYIVGIFFTQLVFSHRVANDDYPPALDNFWGSLWKSTLTLYQAILGGVDWETVSAPLDEVSIICTLVFCVYIAFSLLAMMNIITGTFVQSALKHSENERAQDFRTAAFKAFTFDDGSLSISYTDFCEKIEGVELKHWIDQMGIELQDAKLLYRLLESEDSEVVRTDRLVTSLLSLRDGARFIDVMKLMYEMKYNQSELDARWDELFDNLKILTHGSVMQQSNGCR